MRHNRQVGPRVARAGGQDDGSYTNSLKLYVVTKAFVMIYCAYSLGLSNDIIIFALPSELLPPD